MLIFRVYISNPASEVDHFGSELIAGAGVYGIKAKLRQKQAKIEQTLRS
jgi:hypothetical protein